MALLFQYGRETTVNRWVSDNVALMAQGVHSKIVSERLGHSSVGITLDIDSHIAPGLQAEAAASLDWLLERKEA